MKPIRLLLLISTCIYNVASWCCYLQNYAGCDLGGYVPGGNEMILEPIEAPEATLQEHSVAQIAYYLGLDCSAMGSMVDVASTMKKFENLAAKLSASLSIWGTLLSFAQIGNPTPDDIIDAVNKALATLTAEVNNQFINMQGYVDQHLLDLQNEMMQLDYKSYQTYFSNCIREVTEENVNWCMEEAERISAADYNKFMQFLDYVDIEDWEATPDDIKKMEVQYITFRDYAQLRVMILTTLASTYSNKTDKYSKDQTKRYLETLKTETERYSTYAHFCFSEIVDMHWVQLPYLSKGQTCSDMWEQWESGVHTRNWRTCRHKYSPMLLDSQTCDVDSGVRMDGKHPSPECYEFHYDNLNSFTVIPLYAAWNEADKFLSYNKNMLESAKNFWGPKVFDHINTWDEINNGVKNMLANLQIEEIPEEYLTDQQKINIKNELERIESLRPNYRRGIKAEL